MTKDSRGMKQKESTEKDLTKSSKKTLEEKRLKGNMLLKELFKVSPTPMSPDKG